MLQIIIISLIYLYKCTNQYYQIENKFQFRSKLKMFPTSIDNQYQQRNRRRGRNDPNNRDYICPCGKSYLSYPALFTHIKTKHNGRAPGQIIKPTPQNSRRGRPKARQVYDSQSETQDIASNALDRLCDFVLASQAQKPEESLRFKQIYMKDSFYEIYASFNQQQQEPRYNDADDIFEQTCENVFSQFLAEVQKRLNQPFYVDILFLFVVMMARQIMSSNAANPEHIKQESIQNIVEYVNNFLINALPSIREKQHLQNVVLFSDRQMGRLLEYFFNWLTQKKYLAVKIKMNERYFRDENLN